MIGPRIIVLLIGLAACGGSPRAVESAEPSKPVALPRDTQAPATASATEPTPSSPASSAPDGSATDPVAAEQAAYEAARPVIRARCAGPCHHYENGATARAVGAANLGSYPVTGKYSKVIGLKVREVLGASGAAATMPKDNPGSLSSTDRALILAWADAWSRAHPDATLD